MNTTKTIFLFLSFLAILSISACSSDKANIQMATSAADDLYGAIAKQQFGTASVMYSDRFYERISKNDWINLLQSIQKKLGSYQSRKLTNQSVQRGFNRTSSISIVLVYRVYYQRESAIEKLTFIRPTPDSKTLELVGHSIDFKES